MNSANQDGKTAALFAGWAAGERGALDQLLAHLYEELHRIAARELRSESRLTLRPTALVHEVYLRLIELRQPNWQDRAHFLALAGRVARRVLVDEARRRRADKRHGGLQVTLSDENVGAAAGGFDVLDTESLLAELGRIDPVAAEVVALRVFGGLSIEEAAEVLKLSTATVNRRWVTGKIWLAHELNVRP